MSVAWPAPPAPGAAVVVTPDPNGTTFLFALKHKFGDRPFSRPLKRRDAAIFTHAHALGFGSEAHDNSGNAESFVNFCLMKNGKAAFRTDANFANGGAPAAAYPEDDWHGAIKPRSFVLDKTTIVNTHDDLSTIIHIGH